MALPIVFSRIENLQAGCWEWKQNSHSRSRVPAMPNIRQVKAVSRFYAPEDCGAIESHGGHLAYQLVQRNVEQGTHHFIPPRAEQPYAIILEFEIGDEDEDIDLTAWSSDVHGYRLLQVSSGLPRDHLRQDYEQAFLVAQAIQHGDTRPAADSAPFAGMLLPRFRTQPVNWEAKFVWLLDWESNLAGMLSVHISNRPLDS